MGPDGAPYVTVDELALYFPASALAASTLAQRTQACLDATETADSYLRGRYQLPLLAWGSDLRKFTAYVAVYGLRTTTGFNSRAGADQMIVDRYHEAVGDPSRPGSGWFPGVQRQSIHPDVSPSVQQPGDPTYDLPQVRTSPKRGWQQVNARGKPVIG